MILKEKRIKFYLFLSKLLTSHHDEDFKKSLVNLYHGGKTQTSLCKEYGVSFTALSR